MSEVETTWVARSLLLPTGCSYHPLLDRNPGCFLTLHPQESHGQQQAALRQPLRKKLPNNTPLPSKAQQEPWEHPTSSPPGSARRPPHAALTQERDHSA